MYVLLLNSLFSPSSLFLSRLPPQYFQILTL